MSFYKNAKARPEKLQRKLIIHFAEENGADCGSLCREFFEDALKEASVRVFDGEDKKVPKKDWNMEVALEIVGMLIAHSLMQGGPGFPCLSATVFDYLVTGDMWECVPTKEDIPLDITTHQLITFIEKVALINSPCIYNVHTLTMYTHIFLLFFLVQC